MTTTHNKSAGARRSALRSLGAAAVLSTGLLLPIPGMAQGTTATLGGTVLDATGAVVPGAQILLTNEATGEKRTSTSNGAGVFSFSGLPTGNYDVKISATGFSGFEQRALHLNPGDLDTVRNIALAAGGTSETVQVTSAADNINLDSGEESSLISAKEIEHLSVEGRDVTELFKILPGFAISGGGGGSVNNSAYDPAQVNPTGALGQYSANGTPLNGQALLSDGADITDPGNFGGALQNVNYEQVAEVKVQTSSFTADTAHGPIVINAVGKSGGAQYHGSLYAFARTYQLNSTDWLANYTHQQKPSDRYIYPGFTFGGPIQIPGTGFNRNKHLTFFAGMEDYAQRNVYAYGSAGNAILTALVPTAGMRKGDFSQAQIQQYLGPQYVVTPDGSACNYYPSLVNGQPSGTPQQGGPDGNICRVPQTAPDGSALTNGNVSAYMDPLSTLILNGMPLPNTTSNGTYNWITTNTVNNDLWQGHYRLDYDPNQNNQIFMVYGIEKGAQGVPQNEYYSARGNLGGINVPGGGLVSTISSHLASLNFTHIFSPSLTNEFYAAGEYFDQNFTPKNFAATAGNPYKGVFNNGSTVQPTLEDYGNDGLPLLRTPDATYGGIFAKKQIRTAGDNLTKLMGKHTLRTGVFYQWASNPQVSPFINTNGTVNLYYIGETFSDPVKGVVHSTGVVGSGNGGNYLADFAEGQIFQYNQTNIMPEPNLYFYNLSGYLQDHWRVTPKLSIDAGIRLEHFTPWTDSHGQGVPVFDPTAYANGTNPMLPGMLWHAIDKSIPLSGLATRWAYIEPRLGFSWDPRGTGDTVVRGGFGIYRAHDSYNDANPMMNSALGLRTYYVNGPLLLSSVSSYAAAANSATGFNPDININGFDRNDSEQPRVRTYNLAIDQKLAGKMLLEIAYVGNVSDKLLNDGSTQTTALDDLNSLPVGALFGPQPNTRGFTPGVLYPVFGPASANGAANTSIGSLDQAHIDSYKKYPLYNHVFRPEHNAYANYNGLQIGITRQTGRGNYTVNYTWSKALGVLGVGGSGNNGYPPDPFNYRNDYMEETYDHRHIFNAAYSLDLGNPFKNALVGLATNGWQVSGIVNYQSGANLPSIDNSNFNLQGTLTVPVGTVAAVGNNVSACNTTSGAGSCAVGISSINILGTQDVNLQPRILGDPKQKTGGSHQYVNAAAFGLPALGTNGAYRYGFLPGPGYFNTDLTLAKTFKINDRVRTQLRFAAFNFINHGNNSFTPTHPEQYQLNFTHTENASTLTQALQSAGNTQPTFGFAPLREGRRIVEMGLKLDF